MSGALLVGHVLSRSVGLSSVKWSDNIAIIVVVVCVISLRINFILVSEWKSAHVESNSVR